MAAEKKKSNNCSTKRLFDLIRSGEEDVIIEPLLKHVDINATDSEGRTPLLLACSVNRKKIVDQLLMSGVNVDGVEGRLLYYASLYGWTEIVQSFLKRVPDLNKRYESGDTALHVASSNGHLEVVKYLVEGGSDIHKRNVFGDTALHASSNTGHQKVVMYLVERGSDLCIRNVFGDTALHIASKIGHLEVVKCLVEGGNDIYARNKRNETALHCATAMGHLQIVKWFLKKEPHRSFDLNNTRDDNGDTVLHYASRRGELEIVKYLLDEGPNINVKNSEDDTPLLVAAKCSCKDVVELLMCSGANVDIPNSINSTLLHYATELGWRDVVQSLIKQGCDLDARNWLGITALDYACVNHQLDTVQCLIEAGARWDVVDITHCSPLSHLTREEFIKLFVEDGVYIKPVDHYLILKSSKLEVLQDVKLCCRAIVNRFNKYDLPEFYKLPISRSLPRMEDFQIASDSKAVQEIEQTVAFEIETTGHCNVLEARPMPLRVFCVRSVLECYEKNTTQLQN